MRIHARDMAARDILEVNDWRLHITGIERDNAVALRTVKFAFVIHLGQDELVTVQHCAAAA
jgi:hypothetical protein